MNKSQKVKNAKKNYDNRRNHKFVNNTEYDNFDNVFTYQHFFEALKKCKKGVNWKNSVQKYDQHAITEITNTLEKLREGSLPRYTSTKQIVIMERGKARIIVPITIWDRMTQRVLCDYALVPVLRKTLIYDNGASLSGKGVEFTRNRLEEHLISALREYGTEFYALVFDFKSFFDSIPHRTCYDVLSHNFNDERIVNIAMDIIKSYQRVTLMKEPDTPERAEKLRILENNGSNGICLGSQVSQIMALAVPNKLDHYIKDDRSVKHYIRYMDDGVIFSDSKEFLNQLLKDMRKVIDELGLRFNDKKTRITKMSNGFVFMKVHYSITPSGKILKTLTRPGITRMRVKLKKFRKMVDNGELSYDDVYNSMQSWLAHAKIAMSYNTQKTMLKLYNQLYDGYKITKKYEHCKGGRTNELLQADRWNDFSWDSYISGYEALSDET